VTAYRQGRDREYTVRDDLTANGYGTVLRTAGSRGPVDLIAIKPGQLLLVQVKRSGILPPAAWNALVDLAAMCGPAAVPVMAERPLRMPLRYWRLVARKDRPGPQPMAPFPLDELAAAKETP